MKTYTLTTHNEKPCLRAKNPHEVEIQHPIHGWIKSRDIGWTEFNNQNPPFPIANPEYINGRVEFVEGVDFELIDQSSVWDSNEWFDGRVIHSGIETRIAARLKAPQGETKEHTKQTMYEVSFINFNVNGGDYMLCKNMVEVAQLLERECDHVLDSDPEDIDYPYSVVIKPQVLTLSEYEKLKQEYYEQYTPLPNPVKETLEQAEIPLSKQLKSMFRNVTKSTIQRADDYEAGHKAALQTVIEVIDGEKERLRVCMMEAGDDYAYNEYKQRIIALEDLKTALNKNSK